MSGKFIWTRDTNGMPVYIVPFTFHRCKLARQMLWSCHMLCSHMICLFMPLYQNHPFYSVYFGVNAPPQHPLNHTWRKITHRNQTNHRNNRFSPDRTFKFRCRRKIFQIFDANELWNGAAVVVVCSSFLKIEPPIWAAWNSLSTAHRIVKRIRIKMTK